jgi:hypothetical protein
MELGQPEELMAQLWRLAQKEGTLKKGLGQPEVLKEALLQHLVLVSSQASTQALLQQALVMGPAAGAWLQHCDHRD